MPGPRSLSPPTLRVHAGGWGPIALLVAVPLLATFAYWCVVACFDLSGVAGPGGALMMREAWLNPGSGLSATVLWLYYHLPGVPWVAGARVMAWLGFLFAVAGVMLAAARLGRWPAAIGAGLVVAFWSQSLFGAALLGPHTLSLGLTWLGVGLAFQATRPVGWSLPTAFVGGLFAALGASDYGGALPALPYLVLVPLLGPRDLRWRLLQSGCLGLGLLPVLAGGASFAGGGEVLTLAPAAVLEGLASLFRLAKLPIGYDAGVPVLLALGLLGIVVPARQPREQWLLGVLTLLVLGLVAGRLGGMGLRPRYLVPAMFGTIVLLGVGLGGLADLTRRLGPVRWLPTAVVAGLLVMDAAAFGHAWSARRIPFEGTAPPTLPAPPRAFLDRYQDMVYDFSFSAVGARDLFLLGLQAPAEGIAVVPLRDTRENVAFVGAMESRVPALVLHSGPCCAPSPLPGGRALASPWYHPDEFHQWVPDSLDYLGPPAQVDHNILATTGFEPQDVARHRGCAEAVLQQLDDAGMLLVLPSMAPGQDSYRLGMEDFDWIWALKAAAAERGGLQQASPWWETWQGRDAGGHVPCR